MSLILSVFPGVFGSLLQPQDLHLGFCYGPREQQQTELSVRRAIRNTQPAAFPGWQRTRFGTCSYYAVTAHTSPKGLFLHPRCNAATLQPTSQVSKGETSHHTFPAAAPPASSCIKQSLKDPRRASPHRVTAKSNAEHSWLRTPVPAALGEASHGDTA